MPGTAHYYLYVACKTEGCPSHFNLVHFEGPDVRFFEIVYPNEVVDQCLQAPLRCPVCRRDHRYSRTDLKTKSSPFAQHPPGWKPPLPWPPPGQNPESSN